LTLWNIADKATHECLEEERLLPPEFRGSRGRRRKRSRRRRGGGGGGREVKLVKLVERLVVTRKRCWVSDPGALGG
jgi:hypothetical protein